MNISSTTILSCIGALTSLITGAYLNNIYTWKIKDEVEALDLLHPKLQEIEGLAHDVYEDNYNENCKQFNTAIRACTPLLNRLKNQQFHKQVESYQDRQLYIRNLFYEMREIPKRRDEAMKYLKELIPEYQLLDEELLVSILAYREKITSFSYMLKQLIKFK